MRRAVKESSALKSGKPVAVLCIIAGLVVAGMGAARADQKDQPSADKQALFPKEVVLDGKTYSDAELINAFAEIAFSSYIRPNNFAYVLPPAPPHEHCIEPNVKSGTICGTPQEYKASYPWLYEYLYRDRGTPRYFAINKWTGPIRISIGYPNDLIPVLSANQEQALHADGNNKDQPFTCQALQHATSGKSLCIVDYKDLTEQILYHRPERTSQYTQAQRIVDEEVSAALPALRDLTGLPVSYIPHADETKDNVANVRIILEDFGFNWQSTLVPSGMTTDFVYGVGGLHPEWNSIFYREAVEPILTSAVRFVPFSAIRENEFIQGKDNTRQVDGYLLPNADNSIGMSFCFIYVSTNEALPALVRECLVRSLGLPNAPQLMPSMILGLWNGEMPEPWRRTILGRANPPPDLKEQLVSKTEWGPSSPPITGFDRFIVKTLYNPAISPGMSVTDFYKVVMQDDKGN